MELFAWTLLSSVKAANGYGLDGYVRAILESQWQRNNHNQKEKCRRTTWGINTLLLYSLNGLHNDTNEDPNGSLTNCKKLKLNISLTVV